MRGLRGLGIQGLASPVFSAGCSYIISDPDPLYTIQAMSDTHVGSITSSRLAHLSSDAPIVPLAILHAGDITESGTVAQDAAALTFLNGLPATWYAINGGHDLLTPRTPAQFATAYGMSAQNYVVDLGNFVLIALGPDDSSTVTFSAAQLTFLENSLAGTAKDCIIMFHAPLFNTVLTDDATRHYGSNILAGAWYARVDDSIRTILANHDNAKAWISGHVHAPYQAEDFIKTELVGTHYMAMISCSSPWWTDIIDAEVLTDPIVSLYLSIYADRLEVRVRDHLSGTWLMQKNISFLTGQVDVSPQFDMQFPTDHAAPLHDYETVEPGPGKMYLSGDLTVPAFSGGKFVMSGTPSAVSYLVPVKVMYRKCGRAFRIDVPDRTTIATNGLLFYLASVSDLYCSVKYANSTTASARNTADSGIFTYTVSAGVTHSWMLVMRDTGSYVLFRDSSHPAGQYKLLYVYANGEMALAAKVRYAALAQNFTLDNMKIEDLGGGFATQNGLANYSKAVTVDGDTATTNASFVLEHTITAQTGVTQELKFRYQDDDNTWLVRCDQTAGTIALVTRIAGSETVRNSVAIAQTDGVDYRIVVVIEGDTFRRVVINDTTTGPSYNTAQAALAANVGVKVSHAGKNLICWPFLVTV